MSSTIFTVSIQNSRLCLLAAAHNLPVCSGVFPDISDGPGGILGFGGSERLRANGLPFTGIILFDPDDVATVSDDVALHELGHGMYKLSMSTISDSVACVGCISARGWYAVAQRWSRG